MVLVIGGQRFVSWTHPRQQNKPNFLVNMEELVASGYFVKPYNRLDGGSDVSPPDADSAETREKTESAGSKNGHQRRNKGARRSVGSKRRGDPTPAIHAEEPDPGPHAGSLERTKRLLLAALRVWELKQRIR